MAKPASPVNLRDDLPGRWPRTGDLALAAGLTIAIFCVDTFTEIESAIAVLYVIAIMVAARSLSQRGLALGGVLCGGLAVLSYAISHGEGTTLSNVLRLAVALAAIAITTGLLLRDRARRRQLLAANAALAVSERRYRSIFERSRFSIWELDFSAAAKAVAALRDQGIADLAAHAARHPGFRDEMARLITTVDVNDATLAILGATRREQVLGSVAPFLPEDGPLVRVLQALIEGRREFEGQAGLLGVDGRRRTVLFGLAFPDAEVGRAISTLVDITEREQTQAALQAAQAELARATRAATVGALSATIAHELNQPLGALMMSAQACLRWLKRVPPDLEAAAKAAERTVRDAGRASEIVRQTRGLLARRADRAQALDLRAVAAEVVVLLERELAVQGARVRTAFPADLPAVRAERLGLQQVLINLITNGLQAMHATPPALREMTLSIDRPDGSHVRLSVRDRGAGIGEADLPRLFEPFFTTRQDGMGMGLAISQSIVEAAGGRLTARNHGDGGAVFELLLPQAAADGEQGAQ
jgi:C4-dicarboxylate-specific signal transduction histidine kinase